MDWLINHWSDVLIIAAGIILVASAVVKMTPGEADNKILKKIIAIFQFLALTPRGRKK